MFEIMYGFVFFAVPALVVWGLWSLLELIWYGRK